MKIEMIFNNIPDEIKKIFNSSYASQNYWTPEWEEWAKNAILKCNEARDKHLITISQWEYFRNNYFGKLGGIIGELPSTKSLDFLSFLFYNDDEREY